MNLDVKALLASGEVAANELELALRIQASEGGSLVGPLQCIAELSDEELCVLLAKVTGLPRADGETLAAIRPEVAALLTGELCAHALAVPLRLDPDEALVVAMADPTDEGAQAELEFHSGRPLRVELATEAAIRWAIEQHYGDEPPPGAAFLLTDDDELVDLFTAACADGSEILEIVELMDEAREPETHPRRRTVAH